MKALVKTAAAPGQVMLQDWPDPQVGPQEVMIAVKRGGVCGTDLSLYEWNRLIIEGYKPRIPIIVGHEFTGEVLETGREVTGIRAGDHVVVNPALTCGQCRYCRSEQSMLCPSRQLLGLQVPGAFAEYVVAPANNVYVVPREMPWDLAAMAEPFAVALHALERVPIHPGAVVAIVGPGSIGFCMLAALKLTPVAQVVMIGVEADRERLSLAASLGAATVCLGRDTPEVVVGDLTEGLGADIAFETAGHPAAFATAIRLTRKGGRVGLLGLPHDDASLNTAAIALAELQLVGVRAYDVNTWRRVPTLLERAETTLTKVVTHRLPLGQFEQAVELARSGSGLKVLLTTDEA